MVRRTLAPCLAVMGLLLLAPATPAVAAPGILDATVNGPVFSARVSLLGLIEAELTIAFEQVQNLSVPSLGVSAQLINPLDPFFLARLPAGGLVGIPLALPVLIKVMPPAGGGLEFTGVATLSLHTHILNFSPTLPLRIFSAPPGGHFTEVTDSAGPGSLRLGNRDPEYGREYAVLVDNRPQQSVAASKLVSLETTFAQAASAIPGPIEADLASRLAAIRTAYVDGDIAQAIEETESFSAAVVEASGTAIPNRWRASGDLTNHAGRLRAGAATLRFSLLGLPGAP